MAGWREGNTGAMCQQLNNAERAEASENATARGGGDRQLRVAGRRRRERGRPQLGEVALLKGWSQHLLATGCGRCTP